MLLGQALRIAPAGLQGLLTLNDRTEARTYATIPGSPDYDVETALGAGLSLNTRRTNYFIGYGARLAYLDIGQSYATLALMHLGRVGFGWANARWTVGLSVDGSIGTQSTTLGAPFAFGGVGAGAAGPVAAPPPTPVAGAPAATANGQTPNAPTPTYVPPPEKVYLGSVRGVANVGYAFSHRWSGGIAAGYGLSGGLDDASKSALPPSRVLFASASATTALNARERLGTSLATSYVTVVPTQLAGTKQVAGGDFLSVVITESWEHHFSLRTKGSVGLGVAFLRTLATADTRGETDVTGAGFMTLSHADTLGRASTVTYAGSISVGTAYNQVLGAVQTQLSGGLIASWNYHLFTFAASVAGGSSLPLWASDASRVMGGSLVAAYSPARLIAFQVGGRANAQTFPGYSIDYIYPPEWVAFVAVVLSAPALKL